MTNYKIDLRLLANRKRLEILAIPSGLNPYDYKTAEIAIRYKYFYIVKALKGLYKLGIHHTCNLHELVSNYDSI